MDTGVIGSRDQRDEEIFLAVAESLGYIIHVLLDESSDDNVQRGEILTRFVRELRKEGATEAFMEMFEGDPSRYELQLYSQQNE
ncbi:Fc.00g094460.m01.CDS01 [Cosmosporella sp. VM-42]